MISHALASLLLLVVLVVLVALLLASVEAWKAMRSRPTQPWTSVSDPPRMKRDALPHNRTKREASDLGAQYPSRHSESAMRMRANDR